MDDGFRRTAALGTGGVEAFERVATLALDELVRKAAEAFASTDFGAAIAAEP